ncbi:diguanylate cyclase domain-containing protein [Streptomyces sp. NPDC091972]|uniref:diguanylate cyclase domain-containing protein n=1 Tax=Streptomyces sp. NPDC091972 TaxID=3366007 RepID=UPI00380F1B6A
MPALAALRQPTRTLVTAAAAVPLTGWTVHALTLYRRAAHDPLTGLLRRDAYTARARRLLARHGHNSAVVLVDVDHFKQINDTHGHAVGDRVLAATAARLTAWAGSRGVVGRLGGDEFAAAARIDAAHRRPRLDQLAAALARPVDIGDGRLVDVTVSIGAATPDTIGTTDLSLLLRAADAAMYAGKHTGTAVLADRSHADVPSVNGRRAGRPGTAIPGAAV